MKNIEEFSMQTEPDNPFREPDAPETPNDPNPYPVTDPVIDPEPEPFPTPPEPLPDLPPDVVF